MTKFVRVLFLCRPDISLPAYLAQTHVFGRTALLVNSDSRSGMFSLFGSSEGSRAPLLPLARTVDHPVGRHSSIRAHFTKNLGLIVAILYGIVSISITVFNKAVLTQYKFNYSNTLSLGQGICSLMFLYILRRRKIVSFPDLSWSTAIEVCERPNLDLKS